MRARIFINFFILLYIFFPISNSYSQIGWFQINTGLPSNCYIPAIYFINENTGFISGTYNYNSYLRKTTNGGVTWDSIYILMKTVNKIFFINDQTGFITGSTAAGSYDLGKILKTTNSGINWTGNHINNTSNIFSIDMIDDNLGYCVGYYHYNTVDACIVYKTSDGGGTWGNSFTIYNTTLYYDVDFVNSNIGFVTGAGINGGAFVRTTDSGVNWSILTIPYPMGNEMWTVSFIDGNVGYVGGKGESQGYYNKGIINRTANGGQNWQRIYEKDSSAIHEIFFVDSQIGFAVGAANQYTKGIILKTINGGQNWLIQNITNNVLSDVIFLNSLTGYACGANGIVLKTTDGGGPIGIEPISTRIPNVFILSQNFPNPFNPITHIEFELPIKGYIKLTVYDILGRYIKTLVDQSLNAGSYNVDFDGTNYSSGIYYYRLETEKFAETKKMVLLK